MNIEELERRAKEFLAKSTALNHTKFIQLANPSAILDLIRDNKSRRNMFDMVINSVAAALERAGVTEVDDPGEAIDVLVADKDAEIARLREALERIAKYPLLREEELTAGGCRVIAQDALNRAALARANGESNE